MHCVKNVSKTLDLKHEFGVTMWRHKQRTTSNNDLHTLLVRSHLLQPQYHVASLWAILTENRTHDPLRSSNNSLIQNLTKFT